VEIPEGMVLITRINSGKPGGKVKAYLRHSGQGISEEGLPIFRDDIVAWPSSCVRTASPSW
jgi:hypothetical protein